MPTVMEAIIHAMIDFRREILDNLQLSLEYHTEQLEEIKQYTEYKMQELRDEINQQRSSFEKVLSRSHPISCDNMVTGFTSTFSIRPLGADQPFVVLCNFDNNFNLGGGWTVFQRRIDGSVDFFRNWTMYKHGFGDVNGEHWLGLDNLHIMTKSGRHELLVLLEDFKGNSTYALYDEFKVGNETEKYKLTVGKYFGTAGDSLAYHNGKKFSTIDQDNDDWDNRDFI
ncbi:fibrinogen C domain-containing protein 1-like protein [Anopheles sinensis]|uniref:Fibrinogen C domain-containing protein 1-like protein n=1 Tax=Anopheles sinensis TaxID=74873 RepID=A0A084WEY2_ANOSI|nr:fibrinogen C domain-containing protein 1-like protein [Anopheles sinensis]